MQAAGRLAQTDEAEATAPSRVAFLQGRANCKAPAPTGGSPASKEARSETLHCAPATPRHSRIPSLPQQPGASERPRYDRARASRSEASSTSAAIRLLIR